MTDSITVLLADDHAVLRAGLAMLIDQQADMRVVGQADTAEAALAAVEEHRPDVLVMDLAMPGGGTIDAIAQLRARRPETKVLVLTMFDDRSYMDSVLAAGGSGYVVKSAAHSALLQAIRTVDAGRTYVDVSLTGFAPEPPTNPGRRQPPELAALSEREREVLRLVAWGHTNREIGKKLHISTKSVETYRARVSEKLELTGRAELVRYALANGLLERAP